MNHDRLRLDLADLAEEVTPVDLRDRALHTSRRLRLQRAVASSAAAVVLLAAAAGTAFAIQQNRQTFVPEPASPTITGSWPPIDATPTTGVTPTKPASLLAGTRYYLGKTNQEALIHAVRGDSDTVTARIPLGSGYCVANTVTVSPDGRRLAWVQGDGDSGNLMTSSIDGSQKRVLHPGVFCLGATALHWQGADRLIVNVNGRAVGIDMVSGKPVGGPDRMFCAWSADGRWLAGETDGKPYVTDGTTSRPYHYEPPKDEAWMFDGWCARSVSLDGRYVSIGWIGTDPSRRDDSFTVVDTTSSMVVKLPVSGQIKSIQFAMDGSVLVRQANGIAVLDAGFRYIGQVPESTNVQELTLLAYVP